MVWFTRTSRPDMIYRPVVSFVREKPTKDEPPEDAPRTRSWDA